MTCVEPRSHVSGGYDVYSTHLSSDGQLSGSLDGALLDLDPSRDLSTRSDLCLAEKTGGGGVGSLGGGGENGGHDDIGCMEVEGGREMYSWITVIVRCAYKPDNRVSERGKGGMTSRVRIRGHIRTSRSKDRNTSTSE
jgi:hypothetical protein